MTTEDDFQEQIDRNWRDDHTRLVFADWLQDRDDPRAEGYRVLAEGPWRVGRFHYPTWFDATSYGLTPRGDNLPGYLYEPLAYTHTQGIGLNWKDYWTRREAEDAFALVIAGLSPAHRELLERDLDDHRRRLSEKAR